MSQWYSVAKSIGVYPVGVDALGLTSGYRNHTQSKGILFLDLKKFFYKPKLTLHLHSMTVDNVMHTAFLQATYKFVFQWPKSIAISGQVIRQDGIGNGANPDPTKAYFPTNGKSLSFGSILWNDSLYSLALKYNRVTRASRFLLPREMGLEPFFTCMPGERSDGYGDTHAFALQASYLQKNFKLILAAVFVQTPDVLNFALNKYGLPS